MATRKLLLSKELGTALGVGVGAFATQSQIDELVRKHCKPTPQDEIAVPEEAELVTPFNKDEVPPGLKYMLKGLVDRGSPLYIMREGDAVSVIDPKDDYAGQQRRVGSGVWSELDDGYYNDDTQDGILLDPEDGTGVLWNGKPFNING